MTMTWLRKPGKYLAARSATAQQAEAYTPGSYSGPILSCRGVDVAYDKVQILFGVDMDIEEGEIVALLGTNGAGKSTLLKAISGLVDPIGGSISFAGRDITHADAVATSRMGIVQVPGGKAVFPTLTVAEHFRAGTWLYSGEDPGAVQARVEEVLDQFPRVRERWDQMAGNLSGGEQQQLALGMAFVAKPKILIIDELSLGLAPTIVEQLLGMVRAIHATGCTIILVEQSVNVALTVANRAYFMEKGEVRFSGPTAELLQRDDILRSVFLQGAGSMGDDAPAAAAGADDVDLEAPTGTVPAVPVRKGPEDFGPPILEVNGITKRFGGIRAVNDVSFTLREGEIIGLIGPNGAGKTTIFDMLSGLIPIDAGRIRFKGVDITKMGPDKRSIMGLGRSFQDARIFPPLTVAENIAIGLERHIPDRDHLASLLALPAVQETEADVRFTVEQLIELMNLGAFRDKFVSELSTGSRRIVDLAMAIAHDPSVLILDEPSSGIAQRETEALGPLLRRIQAETKCAMLVIEHDMPLIREISDQLIALELGAVVTIGQAEDVLTHPQVVSAYLGGDLDVINRSGASASAEGPAVVTPAAIRRPRTPGDLGLDDLDDLVTAADRPLGHRASTSGQPVAAAGAAGPRRGFTVTEAPPARRSRRPVAAPDGMPAAPAGRRPAAAAAVTPVPEPAGPARGTTARAPATRTATGKAATRAAASRTAASRTAAGSTAAGRTAAGRTAASRTAASRTVSVPAAAAGTAAGDGSLRDAVPARRATRKAVAAADPAARRARARTRTTTEFGTAAGAAPADIPTAGTPTPRTEARTRS